MIPEQRFIDGLFRPFKQAPPIPKHQYTFWERLLGYEPTQSDYALAR